MEKQKKWMKMTNICKKRCWIAFVIISAIMAIVPMVLCTFRNALFCDSSYYLSIMERVAEGKLLYSDVKCGYTPLWFYLMAGIKLLFRIPYGCVEIYYLFHFLMLLLSALFLYKIIMCLGLDSRNAYFFSWLFIMMSHWMQGNFIILEIPSILFGLLSLWLVLKKESEKQRWLLVMGGVAAACSFLCKQYGLGFFVLSLLLVFRRKCFGHMMAFLIGFLIPVAVCLFVWRYSIVSSTLLNGYGSLASNPYGNTFKSKISTVFYALKLLNSRVAIALPITVLFIPYFWGRWKFIVTLCWMGIFGFLLQYCFSYGEYHYLLYTLPFVMILLSISTSLIGVVNRILRIVFLVALALTVSYTVYADYYNRVYKRYFSNAKQEQIGFSNEIRNLIDKDKTLWIPNSALFYVYYYANILPPNLSTIGYDFGDNGLPIEKAYEQAQSADFVLSSDGEPSEVYFTKELKRYVHSHNAVFISADSLIYLNDMSKLQE